MEKLIEMLEKLDEWVEAYIGAGTCFIVMVILFVALIVCMFGMKDEEKEDAE